MRITESRLRKIIRSILIETPLEDYQTIYRTPHRDHSLTGLGARLERDPEFMSQSKELFKNEPGKWHIFTFDNQDDAEEFFDKTGNGLRDKDNAHIRELLGASVWDSIPDDAYVLVVNREQLTNDDLTAQYITKHDFIGHFAHNTYYWDDKQRASYENNSRRVFDAIKKAYKFHLHCDSYMLDEAVMKDLFMGLREHGLNSNTRDSILDSYSDIIPDILANFILEPQDAGRLEETVYSIVHKTVSKLTGLSSLEKFDRAQLLDVESLKRAVEDFARDYAQNLHQFTVRWKSKLKKKGDRPSYSMVKVI